MLLLLLVVPGEAEDGDGDGVAPAAHTHAHAMAAGSWTRVTRRWRAPRPQARRGGTRKGEASHGCEESR
eukprot:3455691-Ditylum_brightwellii.AAC.1